MTGGGSPPPAQNTIPIRIRPSQAGRFRTLCVTQKGRILNHALLPRFRADAEPTLRRISAPAPVPSAEIWLGVHRENRHVPRVRTVLDTIATAVRSQASLLNPVAPVSEPA